MALLQWYIIIDLVNIEDKDPSSDELMRLIDILFLGVNAQMVYNPVLFLDFFFK